MTVKPSRSLPTAPPSAEPVDRAVVERASLFELSPGDRIEDAGVIVVSSGPLPRHEAFELVRDASGQRRLTSVIRAADDGWRVEGRWDYGADWQAQSARGIGDYNGQPVSIDIVVTAGQVAIDAAIGDVPTQQTVPCNNCLIDMAPSALPMFAMTRRYDEAAGGVQHFNWIGRGLIRDEVLTDGRADLRMLGRSTVTGPDQTAIVVGHYAFTEVLEVPGTGQRIALAFNLYVDADHRPLGFAMPNLRATRVGFEDLPQQVPPVFAPAAP